ncbi:maltokinase N-terminal cap-like domain-containing protein [Streptacidiphilus carbonis]|uniref:maltokinase N-terminal cap-like domain-containing protein n=1 Tax=Streptacidiphilus carbonis TaxID=105422 RepID=UPI0005AB275D|nr:phosphotransferase [Streptacidiphilus carbonis]
MSETSRPRTLAATTTTTAASATAASAATASAATASAKASSTGAPAGTGTVRGTDLDALLRDVLPLLHDWLPRQRWFAGKHRPITGISPATVTLLPGGPDEPLLLHLLLRIEYSSDESDLYQLLLGAAPNTPTAVGAGSERARAAVIGRIGGGPHDGLLTYDATHHPALALRLLRTLIGAGATRSNRIGPLVFHAPHGPELTDLAEPGSSARVGTAEQSNTSIVFGDSAILKLFRRITPGLNPDLELSLALSRAGSGRVPTPLAWFEGDIPNLPGETATLGLLQRYLLGGKDGWEFALAHVNRLRTDPEWQGSRDGHPSDHITGNFSAESFLLGRTTAEVHLALARTLPVTVLDRSQIEATAEAMALRLDAASLAVPALAPYRLPLRRIFQELARSARDGRLLRAQRIHGDLHLGQSMRTARGWALLDFEGEPAKPLEERRRVQPAVRDVAAMLRSFDYAAAHLLTELPPDDPELPRLSSLASTWALRNRAAFCAGYAAAGAEDPTADPVLLQAMETDKAVYEVVYEAGNRPEWLAIPMSAIIRLAQAAQK